MEFRYVPYDPKYYAKSLNINPGTGKLSWDSPSGQDVLIVKTPFGQSAADLMEPELCPVLSGLSSLPNNRFAEVIPGVSVRLVTAADKARDNGCALAGRACTYTVFSVREAADGVCEVFRPEETQSIMSQPLDVPMDVSVRVYRHVVQEGFAFMKHDVDTGFWIITFDGGLAGMSDDEDTGLYYTLEGVDLGGLEIPLTAGAVNGGRVFVKSSARPRVGTHMSGIRVVDLDSKRG